MPPHLTAADAIYESFCATAEAAIRRAGRITPGKLETEFSAEPCELCERPGAGARWAATATDDSLPELPEEKLSVCTDCREYVLQGYLDR